MKTKINSLKWQISAHHISFSMYSLQIIKTLKYVCINNEEEGRGGGDEGRRGGEEIGGGDEML